MIDKLLTITRNDKNIIFVLYHSNNDYTEIITKNYFNFPKTNEVLEGLTVTNEGDVSAVVKKSKHHDYDFENTLSREIDKYIEWCKTNVFNLYITYNNLDTKLGHILNRNYSKYMMTSENAFKRNVSGVMFSQRVKDHFYDVELLDDLKEAITISNYITSRSKGL